MKQILFTSLFMFTSYLSFSQLIQYELKLQDVITQDDSKKIADPIRETFNHFTEPHKFQVKFDSENSSFLILSTIVVDETEMKLIMDKHEKTILKFNATKL